MKKAEQQEFFVPDLCAPQATLFLILLMELLVLVFVLASSPLTRFNWDLFATASLLAQWQMLFSAWLICRLRNRLGELSLATATLASLSLVTLATAVSGLFVQAFLADVLGLDQSLWWILRNALIANVLAAILLRYFYLQQQVRLREQWALQARLDSLQARIRPHFLFNTLNSIASLIGSKPDAAERAVEDLGELFRASLQESHSNTTIDDEIRLTGHYLDIEALRLGERLQVSWDVDDSLRDAPMPSLIIQPLAENAVYHGIARLPRGGEIRIQISRENGTLAVCLTNPYPPGEPGTIGNQMALANVEQRLSAIYGAEASVRTARTGGDFRVEVRYPLAGIVN